MQGTKFDEEKIRTDLLPVNALMKIANIFTYGAKKYRSYEILPIFAIEKFINEQIWVKFKNVKSAIKLKISLQEGCAAPVIKKKENEKLIVNNVENLELLLLKMDIVNLVMKEKGFLTEQKNLKKKQYIKKNIPYDQKIKKKKELETKKEIQIQNLNQKDNSGLWLEILQSTVLQKKNMIIYYQEDAQSVKVQKDHILTMTMQLENSEIYFVVNATKPLDCYRIILKLLEIFLNISININEISKEISGAYNWTKGILQSRLYAACLRHLFAYWGGEQKDPESGMSHLHHAGCCIMMLIDNEDLRKELDDRQIKHDEN